MVYFSKRLKNSSPIRHIYVNNDLPGYDVNNIISILKISQCYDNNDS
jgi:hypothetical protein